MKEILKFLTDLDKLPYFVAGIVFSYLVKMAILVYRRNWKLLKHVFYLGVIKGLVLGGLVVFAMYKPADKVSSDSSADITVNAVDMGKEFVTDKTKASEKYKDKIVAVTGSIESIDKAKDNTLTVIMKTEGGIILCTLLKDANKDAEGMKAGDKGTLKGKFTAAEEDEIDGNKISMVEGFLTK